MGVGLIAVALLVGQTTKALGDLATFDGNVSFYAGGNTMGEALASYPDGLACVKRSNTAEIPASVFGPRAAVLKAYLYYSGNAFLDSTESGSVDLTEIDRDVRLQLPGQASAIAVAPEVVHVAQFLDTAIGIPRQSYYYSARADITEVVKANASVAGTYVFSELETPICPDPPDKYCDASQMPPPSCSSPYQLATASFMIVVVFSDPALSPRTVKLFDGLEIISSSNPSRQVTLSGIDVSAIPRGALTLYGLEGDPYISDDTATINAGRGPVPLGREITGPTGATSCASSTWPNWNKNIFDSSSVLDPLNPTGGQCTRGIDLDTFDISSLLQPHDTSVALTISSPQDTIAVAFAAIGLDVFRPVLDVDSRKQVLGATGTTVSPNQTITYRIGLSNTGNIPATGVSVVDDMPRFVSNLTMLRTPPGAIDRSTATGGLFNTGQVRVDNITVKPGDVFEVRYSVDVTCPAPDGASIQNSATMSDSAEGAKGGRLTAAVLRVSDPNGDICAGRTPVAPSGAIPGLFNRRLLGGAGCNAAGPNLVLIPVLLLLMIRGCRRGRGRFFLLLLTACSGRFVPGPPDPVGPTGVTAMGKPMAPATPTLPGTICPGHNDMVQVGTFCIDRYEAVLDGSNARQTYAAIPTAGVSFDQAKAACSAAGKRLCTGPEWEKACRGSVGRLYPYGDTFAAKRCNGFDAEWGEVLQAGAMSECNSDYGTFDMSGNVSEWADTDFPRVDGSMGKQLRGGSYLGNAAGMSCTVQIAEVPSVANEYAGIRCCF